MVDEVSQKERVLGLQEGLVSQGLGGCQDGRNTPKGGNPT